MGKTTKDDGPKISPEERDRIAKSARQVVSYANFLRWSANFRRDEVLRHPNHDRVMLLSPMQSSKFCFAIDSGTVLLGVQNFEAAWMAAMPFECAYVSDRLYLSVEGVVCMEAKLPPLVLGIFVDDNSKRIAMAGKKFMQPIRVKARDGQIVEVGEFLGTKFPIKPGDVIKELVTKEKEKLRQQDISRFF